MFERRSLRAVLSVLTAVALLLGMTAVPAAAAETGSISGSFLRGPGRPLVVGVRLNDLNGNQRGWTATDTEGRFRFEGVPVGEYRIGFFGPERAVQYWPQQVEEYRGSTVTVTAGGTAVVEETALPLGDLEFTVTDQATGQPIPGARLSSRDGPYAIYATTDTAGVARFGPIRATTWSFGIQADGYQYDIVGETVVRADQTTSLPKTLARVAVLKVEFASAVTGAAVGKACVGIADADQRDLDQDGQDCAHGTGRAEITYLAPGKYRLFAMPGDRSGGDGVHGSQWVGPEGGTGDPAQAKLVELRSGETTEVRVRFDGAGSITGSVTDTKTGTPVSGLCPGTTPASSGSRGQWGVQCTYTEGRYTIADLGPYDWRVQFPDMKGKYAWQWSGEAPDRLAATPVRVTAGAATTLDARLKPAAKVTGKVIGNTIPFRYVSVNAYNARTGDAAGPDGRVTLNGQYFLSGLASQEIKIGFYATRHQDWYPKPVHVTAGLTLYGLDLHATPEK
ncbi:hypothetical protein M8C13_29435 [Crossiella sp. SN42]|uniref:MSCRAMM family protein n=1 Tax=Crossiella sp. SN42 TaxID=2944808 RepID=UPI00207C8C28|nr:hypothetical protein [Crossiella sp. SN42]MCO1579883.1 hypothetical protein [Crossiella sp. SN42]